MTDTQNIYDIPFDQRFFEALVEMEDPIKTATADVQMRSGGHYSYDYTTLKDVADIVKPILLKHGLFYRQGVERVHDFVDGQFTDTKYVLCTYIIDPKEEKLKDCRPLPHGSDAQKDGAYETYMRRYSLLTVCGMCPIDTDAAETAGATMTSKNLRGDILRGLQALKDLGVDPDTAVPGYEGWETDSRVAKNYLDALVSTFNAAKTVQGAIPGTELGA